MFLLRIKQLLVITRISYYLIKHSNKMIDRDSVELHDLLDIMIKIINTNTVKNDTIYNEMLISFQEKYQKDSSVDYKFDIYNISNINSTIKYIVYNNLLILDYIASSSTEFDIINDLYIIEKRLPKHNKIVNDSSPFLRLMISYLRKVLYLLWKTIDALTNIFQPIDYDTNITLYHYLYCLSDTIEPFHKIVESHEDLQVEIYKKLSSRLPEDAVSGIKFSHSIYKICCPETTSDNIHELPIKTNIKKPREQKKKKIRTIQISENIYNNDDEDNKKREDNKNKEDNKKREKRFPLQLFPKSSPLENVPLPLYHQRVTRWFKIDINDEIPFDFYNLKSQSYQNDMIIKHRFCIDIDRLIYDPIYSLALKSSTVTLYYMIVSYSVFGVVKYGYIEYVVNKRKQIYHRFINQKTPSELSKYNVKLEFPSNVVGSDEDSSKNILSHDDEKLIHNSDYKVIYNESNRIYHFYNKDYKFTIFPIH